MSTGSNNITFAITDFDINIKDEICTAMCYTRSDKSDMDICPECFGLSEPTAKCPYIPVPGDEAR